MKPPTESNAMLSSAPRQTAERRCQPATRIPVICVVDPKRDDYQGWEAQVQATGGRLQFFTSAAGALKFSRTNAVDLWVVNTKLPGLTGAELCSMLKSQSVQTSVYLVADEYSPEVERAAWRARATLFGCKGGHDEWLNDSLEGRLSQPLSSLSAGSPALAAC